MAEAYGTRPSELLASWPAFCLDEALFVRHRIALADEGGESRFRPDGYDPPDVKDRRKIPWGGDGPDPLGGTL